MIKKLLLLFISLAIIAVIISKFRHTNNLAENNYKEMPSSYLKVENKYNNDIIKSKISTNNVIKDEVSSEISNESVKREYRKIEDSKSENSDNLDTNNTQEITPKYMEKRYFNHVIDAVDYLNRAGFICTSMDTDGLCLSWDGDRSVLDRNGIKCNKYDSSGKCTMAVPVGDLGKAVAEALSISSKIK